MTDRPYGELTSKELREKIRGFTVGDMRRKEIQAELDLRQMQTNSSYLFWTALAAAIAAVGSMITAIISLVLLLSSK